MYEDKQQCDHRLRSRGVALVQNLEVMPRVSRDDVGECADADRLVTGGATPVPGFGRQVTKEGDGRPPYVAPFSGQIGQDPVSGSNFRNVGLVVEAGQRSAVATA